LLISNRILNSGHGLQSPDITHGLLVLQTWVHYERGELGKIVDTDDLDIEEAFKFLKIGLLCSQDGSKLRPSMSTVLKMLTGNRDVKSETITKRGLISDFMELKIRSHDQANKIYTSSTMYSGASPLSSGNNTHAAMPFTAISDRD